jgi:hypothetical protein
VLKIACYRFRERKSRYTLLIVLQCGRAFHFQRLFRRQEGNHVWLAKVTLNYTTNVLGFRGL